jgi:hypothetical protein
MAFPTKGHPLSCQFLDALQNSKILLNCPPEERPCHLFIADGVVLKEGDYCIIKYSKCINLCHALKFFLFFIMKKVK